MPSRPRPRNARKARNADRRRRRSRALSGQDPRRKRSPSRREDRREPVRVGSRSAERFPRRSAARGRSFSSSRAVTVHRPVLDRVRVPKHEFGRRRCRRQSNDYPWPDDHTRRSSRSRGFVGDRIPSEQNRTARLSAGVLRSFLSLGPSARGNCVWSRNTRPAGAVARQSLRSSSRDPFDPGRFRVDFPDWRTQVRSILPHAAGRRRRPGRVPVVARNLGKPEGLQARA